MQATTLNARLHGGTPNGFVLHLLSIEGILLCGKMRMWKYVASTTTTSYNMLSECVVSQQCDLMLGYSCWWCIRFGSWRSFWSADGVKHHAVCSQFQPNFKQDGSIGHDIVIRPLPADVSRSDAAQHVVYKRSASQLGEDSDFGMYRHSLKRLINTVNNNT